MTRPPTFHLARVFGSASARGNPTAVVTAPRPADPLSTARRIGVPDTAFVDVRGTRSADVATFSADEEINFCVQTALATAAVLHLLHDDEPRECTLSTATGEVVVAPGDDDVWWLRTHGADPAPSDAGDDLVAALGLDDRVVARRARVAGAARRRLYAECRDAGTLAAADLDPEDVVAACRAHGLNGVCLFVAHAPERVSTRVFTTSLAGREDAATGGAALDLVALLAADGAAGPVVEVDQGGGAGALLVDTGGGAARVGGRVDVVAAGDLLDVATRPVRA